MGRSIRINKTLLLVQLSVLRRGLIHSADDLGPHKGVQLSELSEAQGQEDVHLCNKLVRHVCVSTPGQRVSFDHSNQAGGSRESTVLLPTKTAVDIP